MIVLPIVGRELRVASRRAGTWRARWLTLLAACVVFGWEYFAFRLMSVPASVQGRMLFSGLSWVASFYCLFAGAFLTADSLSAEKRDGTLGLLFLTDLKGYDVIFGKLAATSMNSVYGLLAILPALAITLLLGGVTAAQYGRTALVLVNTLWFSLAAGIFVSTWSRNERKATFGTVLFVLGAVFSPIWLVEILGSYFPGQVRGLSRHWPFLMASPAFSFSAAVSGTGRFPDMAFWGSVLTVHGLGWGLLCWSSAAVPRVWQDRVIRPRLARILERLHEWTHGTAEQRRRFRRRMLAANPFLWLAAREQRKPRYVWLFLGSVAAVWVWGQWRYFMWELDPFTVVPVSVLVQIFFKIWVVSEACARFAEDRRSGTLELVLSTPLAVREILEGQWQALWRQFGKPVLAITVVQAAVLGRVMPVSMVIAGLMVFIGDLLALSWLGMWLGLQTRSTVRAILLGSGLILILPWLVFWTVWGVWRLNFGRSMGLDGWVFVWMSLTLLNDLVWGLVWARNRLHCRFRQKAFPDLSMVRDSRPVRLTGRPAA